MNYYKQKQLIAKVDKKGNVIGQIEKWEAHKNGILHKALTIALIYKDYYIVQHRKHPAFNGVYDVTSSSHPLFIKNKLQTSEDAALDCLQREWNMNKKDIYSKIINNGSVYYKAKDKYSIYTEHEVCDILTVKIKQLPNPNLEFAYGFSLIKKEELNSNRIYTNLAPWVKTMLKKDLL